MKVLLVVLLLSIFSQSVFAKIFSSTIYSIEYGENGQADLVKFDNGKVGFLDLASKAMRLILKESFHANQNVEIELDAKFNIIGAKVVSSEEFFDPWEGWNTLVTYKPSVLPDTSSALKILNRMRRDFNPEGQCYNRAHIWDYEEYNRSKIRSMKMFLFFTNRYIRNYRFHWWFHVTPMVYVGKEQRTLDRRYTSNPLQTKTWTDVFIKSKRSCPKINKFDSYANEQENQDCYLISASMYYVIPRDLEKRDLTGVEKESFVAKEIERAYRDGFNQFK